MLKLFHKVPLEVWFAGGMVAVMLTAAWRLKLPVLFPAANCAALVGIHYLVPIIVLVLLTFRPKLDRGTPAFRASIIVLPCFAVVLWVHFNFKLWTPLINPTNYDAAFWSIDQSARPLVEMCFAIRRWLLCVVPYEFNLYVYVFILLFYTSYVFHARQSPHVLRHLFRAVLYMQGLGALAYLAFPALGPFIFEDGVNAVAAVSQHRMLDVHAHLLQEGAAWLKANGSADFVAGLGAMPSLHVGQSFVLLWFAARYGRVLLVPYVPAFAYIVIVAIANRWHYLIDLPAGIALAGVCLNLAYRFDGQTKENLKEGRSVHATGWLPDLIGSWTRGLAQPGTVATLASEIVFVEKASSPV